MAAGDIGVMPRRAALGGGLALGLLTLAGCESLPPLSLTEAVRRLLVRASRNALDRMLEPGGFWDDQIARLNLPQLFPQRGGAIERVLTSALLRQRMRRELGVFAARAARRAAPVVADAVRVIGVANAKAIVEGGPTVATSFLRSEMGPALVDVMVPELGDAFRLTQDPLFGDLLGAATGVDVSGYARTFAGEIDRVIWDEIGREESAIRYDPRATGDPVLIGAFGRP